MLALSLQEEVLARCTHAQSQPLESLAWTPEGVVPFQRYTLLFDAVQKRPVLVDLAGQHLEPGFKI